MVEYSALSSIAVSGYVIPPPVLALGREPLDVGEDQWRRLAEILAKARPVLRQHRIAFKQQSRRLETLFHQAEDPRLSPRDLEGLAGAVGEAEQQVAETLLSQIEQFRSNIDRSRDLPDTEVTRSLRLWSEQNIEIDQAWLELYQNLRIRLLKLASERRAAAGETGSPIFSDADEMERYLHQISGE